MRRAFAFVSQDQRQCGGGTSGMNVPHPRAAATNYRGKPARVADDKSKGEFPSIFVRRAYIRRARGSARKRIVPGTGQVNQKIARHTQNSAAQWNLNSARAAELNSLLPACMLAHRRHSPSSFPLGASYSLSFVIRKQTESGGLAKLAESEMKQQFPSVHPSSAPIVHFHPVSRLPSRFPHVRESPDSSSMTIMQNARAAKGGRHNSLPKAGRDVISFFLRRGIPLEKRGAEFALANPVTSSLYDCRHFAQAAGDLRGFYGVIISRRGDRLPPTSRTPPIFPIS